MINYSIIIPTKNIPTLLNRCLSSIPQRDDVEIIIIDDNSDPNIVDFNNYPGCNRKNTTIIYSDENKGAGAARNKGLKIAKGKWLIFIDSDDLLMPCANECFDRYTDSNADIIFFLPTSADCVSLEPANRHFKKFNEINSLKNNRAKLEHYLRYRYTEPWGKFIKRSFVCNHNITFEESLVANDYRFSIQTGYYAKNIILDSSQIYCVTVRQGSLSNNIFDRIDKVESRLNVYLGIQKFTKAQNIKNIKPFNLFVSSIVFRHSEYIPVLKNFCKLNNINYPLLVPKSICIKVCFSLRKILTKYFKNSHIQNETSQHILV